MPQPYVWDMITPGDGTWEDMVWMRDSTVGPEDEPVYPGDVGDLENGVDDLYMTNYSGYLYVTVGGPDTYRNCYLDDRNATFGGGMYYDMWPGPSAENYMSVGHDGIHASQIGGDWGGNSDHLVVDLWVDSGTYGNFQLLHTLNMRGTSSLGINVTCAEGGSINFYDSAYCNSVLPMTGTVNIYSSSIAFKCRPSGATVINVHGSSVNFSGTNTDDWTAGYKKIYLKSAAASVSNVPEGVTVVPYPGTVVSQIGMDQLGLGL